MNLDCDGKKFTIGGVILVVLAILVIIGCYSCDEVKKQEEIKKQNSATEARKIAEDVYEEKRLERRKKFASDVKKPHERDRIEDIINGNVKPKFYADGRPVEEEKR